MLIRNRIHPRLNDGIVSNVTLMKNNFVKVLGSTVTRRYVILK